MSNPIRVFVTDDHSIVRKGIKATLAMIEDMELVGEAANGREAVERVATAKPDVVLMDLVMPEMDGIEAIRRIKSQHADIQILVLTTFAGEDKIFPAIKAGALGYQLKDSGPEELLEAIRQVNRGESSLHPIIARKVLAELTGPTEKPTTADPLTAREIEVLRLVAQGMENPEIAEKLVISEATVRTHVSNIMSKLHLASRTQAALYALREGLAVLEDERDKSNNS
ncbi:MAG: response regulator transcription factor [Anaerolineae bacterium]|nr:response regulator transcription factor [Anaerolineae bacterium]